MVRPFPHLLLYSFISILSLIQQGLGVGLTVLRQSIVFGSTALRRRMLVSLEIPNRDRAYEWVLKWMAATQAQSRALSQSAPKRNGLLSLIEPKVHQLSVETRVHTHKNGSASVGFELVAGPGMHWFRYRGAWMQVSFFFKATSLVKTL